MSTSPQVWLAAFLTLAMFSLAVYKENPVYRVAEHAFIGIGAGHAIVTGIQSIQTSGWDPLVKNGEFALLIPMLFGLMLFTKYVKPVSYLARAHGCYCRDRRRPRLEAQSRRSFEQISATFLPLNSFNNIVVVAGFIVGTSYFLFTRRYTRPLEGPLGILPRLGRWFLMIAFGASFGNASMGFLSMLIGRALFLVRDWLGLSKLI